MRRLPLIAGIVIALLASACQPGDETDPAATETPAADAGGEDGEETAAATATDTPTAGDEDFAITLIQGVRGDEFYITMECGAREAAEELGVTLNVQGPESFDPTLQTPILNAVIAEGPDAILIAPTDRTAMIPPLQQAQEAGIEIVLVDTIVDDDSIGVARIATDNVEGGRLAAETLAELIGEEGSVMVVTTDPGVSTVEERQQGFEEAIAEFDGIEYLGTEFSHNEPQQAASIVTSTLAANPDLAGVFATNLFSAEGSATGLRQAGATDVAIVGFDAGPGQVAQLEQGLVQALVAQNPREMGRLGVETAVAALRGESVEADVQTSLTVATPDNLDDPEVEGALYVGSC